MNDRSKLLWLADRALYGKAWGSQAALAADLGVNVKTLRRWSWDESPVPDRAILALMDLLDKRADECANVRRMFLAAIAADMKACADRIDSALAREVA